MIRECNPGKASDPDEELILGHLSVGDVMTQVMPEMRPGDVQYDAARAAVVRAAQVAVEGLTASLASISLAYSPSVATPAALMAPARPEREQPAAADERKQGEPGGAARSESRPRHTVGISLVKAGNVAWSLPDTRSMVSGHSKLLDGNEEWVGVTGRAGIRFHHLSCHYLYCTKGALAHKAFHGGVRIATRRDAQAAGFLPGGCCCKLLISSAKPV
jgi:hypothetical protein